MAHIPPLDMDSHPELQPAFASAAAAMGFVPNSTRTMAHMRQLPFVFSALFATIMGGDAKAIFAGLQEPRPSKMLPGKSSCRAAATHCILRQLSAGCRYCQAHTGHNTERVSGAELQAERLAQVLVKRRPALALRNGRDWLGVGCRSGA